MKHQYIPTAIQSGAFGKPTLISKLDSFISFLVIQLIKRGVFVEMVLLMT